MKQIGIIVALLAIAGLSALGLVWPSQAAPTANTIIVTTTSDNLDAFDQQCSLREALQNANNNTQFSPVVSECVIGSASEADVIVLASGETYPLSLVGSGDDKGDLDILDNSLPLDLRMETDGAIAATIQMTVNGQRVMEIHSASLELDNLAISGGGIDGPGGGIMNDGGEVTLNNMVVRSNAATAGGGLYNTGTAVITNSQFILNNGSFLGGGGIYTSGDLTLSNSMIRANEASSGGGIYHDGGTLLVQTDSSINLNTAVNDGGGIYLSNTIVSADILHTTLDGNQAGDEGGGICFASLSFAKLLVEYSLINNNTADSGGGISGVGHINHTQVSENNATVFGGGLFTTGSFDLYDVEVNDNTALLGAGVGGGSITADKLFVHGNQATGNGGGLHVSYIEMQDSQIFDNTAGTFGGGLYSDNGVAVNTAASLERVLVTDNISANGGGIWTDRHMTLSNVTISSNAAIEDGSGLYIALTGFVTATNTTLAINMPGIDLYKMGQLTLQNSIISNLEQPNCITSLDFPEINSLGNNLSDDNSCLGLDEPTDIINPDTLLGPLADNGGGTQTHDLLAGSPALDTGNAVACAGSLVKGVDQRGIPRPLGMGCDMGAVEKGSVVYLPMIVR